MSDTLIHESALVSKKAQIGKNVKIGAFTIIGDDAVIGDNTEIQSHCVIGIATPLARTPALLIGANSLIRSHSRFYNGSDFSKGVSTGHNISVRENTVGGAGLQLGSSCDILGDCSFGDHTRLHSSVFVAKNAKVGSFVWLAPFVVLTDDPHPPSIVSLGVTVEDYAIVAARSVILPGITIGTHSLVAANSLVNRDVAARSLVGGMPAKILGDIEAIKLRNDPDISAYPWPRHFHRGYPEDIVAEWKKEYKL